MEKTEEAGRPAWLGCQLVSRQLTSRQLMRPPELDDGRPARWLDVSLVSLWAYCAIFIKFTKPKTFLAGTQIERKQNINIWKIESEKWNWNLNSNFGSKMMRLTSILKCLPAILLCVVFLLQPRRGKCKLKTDLKPRNNDDSGMGLLFKWGIS